MPCLSLLPNLVVTLAAALLTASCSTGAANPKAPPLREPAATTRSVSVTTRAYGPEPKQRLDHYKPQGAGDAVVVYLHGGVWQHGDRQQYRHVGEGLATHGLETLVASYRLAPKDRFPAQVEDAAATVAVAVEAARRHSPPLPVVVIGHSAGAHLAMLLVTQPRWLAVHDLTAADVDGVVNISGVFDLALPLDEAQADGGLTAFVTPVFDDDDLKDASPIHLPVPDAVRLLFITGPSDYLAMQAQTAAERHALSARGRETPLVLVPGRNHFQLVEGLGDVDDAVTVAVVDFARHRG